MKNISFIKVPFPSLIVHRYCMWGGPPVVFIAIDVGGPPENRDHVTGGQEGRVLRSKGTAPRWPKWDNSMGMFKNCNNAS